MAETDKTRKRDKTLIAAIAVLAALVTFVVYLSVLKNGFVNWDDPAYVIDNRFIRFLDPAFFGWVFKAVVVSNWHPLTMVSHAVDYALFGLNPWGHHLTSIILHGLNTFAVAVLAIALARAALKRRGGPDNGAAKRVVAAGIITALLFGLHPLHVESVAWVAERKDVLSGFFFLLSLLCYLGYNRDASGKKGLYYALALMAFIAALMSKPMAVTLPAVLLIIDFYPLGRLGPKGDIKRCLVEKAPFFALSLLSSGATLWAQRSGGAVASMESHPLMVRLFVAMRAPVFYLYKMVWPVRLAPYYPHPVEVNYLGLEYAGAIIILICLSAFCIFSLTRTRLFLAVWLYYLVTLLPVLGIVQVGAQGAADRYTYLPSLGPFILAAAGAAYLMGTGGRRRMVTAACITAIILVTLAAMTTRQTKVWKDSITLWSHEIRYYKGSPGADASNVIAYYNRAKAYDELGDLKRAIEDYTMVVTLSPGYVGAYLNRGVAYGRGGDYERAAADFGSALSIDPLNADAYYNRALAHKSSGRNAEAIEDLRGAIKINPGYGPAYYTLSAIYSEIGEKEAAMAAGRRAAELGLR